MKKAMILNTVQELEEVLVLQDIKAPGTYAVKGFDRPVDVMEVTLSVADALTAQYPHGKLFEGADGCRYFAIKTGRFVE